MNLTLPATTPRLRGDRVLLRGLVPADVEGRRRLGSDPGIIRAFGGTPAHDEPWPMAADDALRWYAQAQADPNPLAWIIEHDGRFIGTTGLTVHNANDRRARFGIGILDARLLGRGLGTEASGLVLDYGFDVVGLHRIDLRVLATNERARRCYHRCGFVEEGVEREAALVEGGWQDDVMMALLAHERP